MATPGRRPGTVNLTSIPGTADMAATHLALLRGVNVGGRNKLAMKELAGIFREFGCHDVSTFIQSGNVIFGAAPEVASTVAAQVAARIADRFGYRTPVILRTAGELAAAVAANPFVGSGCSEDELHVYFLAGPPAPSRVARLDPDRSPPDRFEVRGREVYLRLPAGMARTKLTNAYFDAQLATTSTGRNWRTTARLLELMAAP
jgi:uncharacterized protein (DUF1697 family)